MRAIQIVAGLVVLSACDSPAPVQTPTATNTSAPAPAAEAAAPVALSSSELSDPSFLDDKYSADAEANCSGRADEYLRSVANYDFAWDDGGWLSERFDRYMPYVVAPGTIVAVSLKAKLQNGFGAFQHVTLYCVYDTQKRAVLEYALSPPQPYTAQLDRPTVQAPTPLSPVVQPSSSPVSLDSPDVAGPTAPPSPPVAKIVGGDASADDAIPAPQAAAPNPWANQPHAP